MFKKLVRHINNFNATRELSRYQERINQAAGDLSVDSVLSVVFDEPYKRFFWILQVRSEFAAFSERVKKIRPATVLEIGTARGGSLFTFSKLSQPSARIFSIDLPGGDFGGGYPKYKEAFYRSFARKGQTVVLMREDSHSPTTLETLKKHLGAMPLDLLFIDGDHTYEGVKRDFEMYAPLVRRGGLIALHDIVEHPKEWNVGVSDFWKELSQKFNTTTLIEDVNQGWGGIGVIDEFDPNKLNG